MAPVPAPHRALGESSGSEQPLKANYKLRFPPLLIQMCVPMEMWVQKKGGEKDLVVYKQCVMSAKWNTAHMASMFERSSKLLQMWRNTHGTGVVLLSQISLNLHFRMFTCFCSCNHNFRCNMEASLLANLWLFLTNSLMKHWLLKPIHNLPGNILPFITK